MLSSPSLPSTSEQSLAAMSSKGLAAESALEAKLHLDRTYNQHLKYLLCYTTNFIFTIENISNN